MVFLAGLIFLLIIAVLSLLHGYLHYRRRELERRESQPVVQDVISRLVNALSFWAKIQLLQQTKSTVFLAKGSSVIFRCPKSSCDHWCEGFYSCPECHHYPSFTSKERDLITLIPHKTAELSALKEAVHRINAPSLDIGL